MLNIFYTLLFCISLHIVKTTFNVTSLSIASNDSMRLELLVSGQARQSLNINGAHTLSQSRRVGNLFSLLRTVGWFLRSKATIIYRPLFFFDDVHDIIDMNIGTL